MKYNSKSLELFFEPSFCGKITNASGIGKVYNSVSEETTKIFLVVTDGTITDIRYLTSGSITLYASLDILSSLVVGQKVESALKFTESDIMGKLKQVPKSKIMALGDAILALKKALLNYNNNLQKGKLTKQPKVINISIKLKIEREPEQMNFEEAMLDPTHAITTLPIFPHVENQKPVVVDVAKPEIVEAPAQKKEKPAKAKKVIEKQKETKEPAESAKQADEIKAAPTKIKVKVVEAAEPEPVFDSPEQEFAFKKQELKKGKRAKAAKKAVVPVVTKPAEEPASTEQVVTISAEAPKTTTRTTITEKTTTTLHAVSTTGDNLNEIVAQGEETNEANGAELDDEIDTITAKLTDAISKLNFKFDDEDND
mgnify:CR=1 FL=1